MYDPRIVIVIVSQFEAWILSAHRRNVDKNSNEIAMKSFLLSHLVAVLLINNPFKHVVIRWNVA